jgi:hypothetical protein
MKKHLLAAGLILLGSLCMHAQKFTIENVRKASLRNAGDIKEGGEVKGYYFFYESDKIDKKTREYTLHIKDNTLKTLKDIKFQDSRDVVLLESAFNGKDLIFLFYNTDTRMMDYQVYGADGKKKFNYTRELSKKEDALLEGSYKYNEDDEDQTYKGLYPIEGKGFISVMPSREEKDYTFQVDFFSTEKRKQWTYIPTIGGKRFMGDYLGTFNGVVYIEVLKTTGGLDGNPDSYILGLAEETGKLLFEKATDKSKYNFYPITMSMINGKSYLYGEYFDPGTNMMKAKSLGFAFWGMDEKGAITSEKYCSWTLELSKYLDVSSKGKIADFGYMFMHNMVPTASGDIYVIGEGLTKAANALGIAASILSRSTQSLVKVKVTDLMLIKFDKDFNVKEARIYQKNTNVHPMPSTVGLTSIALLGKVLKQYGGYDYAYTQSNKDHSSFSICYTDYIKGKDYKGGTFNSISYNEGKITTDKINTKSDATSTAIFPSSQGQVLVMDYYRKAKKLEMHIEKLN